VDENPKNFNDIVDESYSHTATMETGSFSEDLRFYVALLWSWAWLLILAALLAGVTAFFVSRSITPVYEAVTTVLINEAPSASSNEYTALLTSERLARTYSELITKGPILDGVIDRLSLDDDREGLADAIDVQLVRDTRLIEVRVQDTSPSLAAFIADTLVDEFITQTQSLQNNRFADSKASLEAQLAEVDTQIQETSAALTDLEDELENQDEQARLATNLAQYRQTYAGLLQSYEDIRVKEAQSTSNVVQVEPALVSENPVRPRILLNTALASIVGLMIAVGIVFLREVLDDTVKGPDDITRQLGLPVLGLIARAHPNGENGPISATDPRSPIAEAFRSLRSNIQFTSVDQPLQSLLVSSATPEDGKTTVSANLGVVLAQAGKKITMVDADLRRPRLHERLHVSNRSGLSDLFVQESLHLDGFVRETLTAGLQVIPTGPLPPNPAELVGSQKMNEILAKLKEESDLIVIDSPPVMAASDAAVLAAKVDGVLLVVKPGSTKIGALHQTVAQLHRSGANLLGVVLNDVVLRRGRYNYYYQDYQYSSYAHYNGDGTKGANRSTYPGRKEKIDNPTLVD
jgi:non-specific protein-tyrosine kinase